MKKRTLRIVGFSALLLASGIIGGLIISQLFGVGTANVLRSEQFHNYMSELDERLENLPPADRNLVLVAKRVTPAIVTIISEKVVNMKDHPDLEGMPEQFRRYFEERQPDSQLMPALGSGVVIASDGLILTNNHVIEGAENIQVTFSDKLTLKAEVIGSDSSSDLALLRVKANNLPILEFGDSEAMEVGEQVLAIGNPFNEYLRHTVTAGIVSGKGRHTLATNAFQDFIQTDAAINPGNSGGALVNLRGELIGINTMIVSRTGTYNGIGFAIPSNLVKVVKDSLLRYGKVQRGYLGVFHKDLDEGLARSFGLDRPMGALINSVVAGSPADKAGLRSEDIILEVNGQSLENAQDLLNKIGLTAPGETVEIGIMRNGVRKTVEVVLAERPNDDVVQERAPVEEIDNSKTKLGMRLDELSDRIRRQFGDDVEGALVTAVEPGSAAETAGIRQGMIISKVGGEKINSVEEFFDVIDDYRAGEYVRIYLQFRDAAGQFGGTYVAIQIPE